MPSIRSINRAGYNAGMKQHADIVLNHISPDDADGLTNSVGLLCDALGGGGSTLITIYGDYCKQEKGNSSVQHLLKTPRTWRVSQ